MKSLLRVATIVLPVVMLALCLAAQVASADSPRDVEAVDLVGPPATPVSAPPDCPQSWRAVRLKCKPGAEGIATGNYGGTDFFLTCDEETRICSGGTSYRYLMEGMAPDGPIVRCASSGDAVQVNEFCGPLHLIIN